MAERSCVSLPTVRHYIQTLITGVFRSYTHDIKSLRRMVVFGEVHHLLIDIQPMNPRRYSTFLFLVPNQRFIKIVRPSSVSPLLVKGKAYVLFSWKSVNLLPLCYDREIKDLIFFYNCLYGISPIDVNNFVNFIPHTRTRNCFNPEILLKTQSCNTSSFKASYFNRITKLWNIMCKVAPPSSLGTLSSFKNFVTNFYFDLLANVFDIDQPCTWSAFIDCSCHRIHSHWFITL